MSNGSQKAHLSFEIASYVSICYFNRISLCHTMSVPNALVYCSREVSLKARRRHVLWLAGMSLQIPLEAENAFTMQNPNQGEQYACQRAGGGKKSVICMNSH